MSKKKDKDLPEVISRLKTKILAKNAFLGFLILHLKLHATDQVPIAGVQKDGTLLINPEAFLSESEEEQVWTLCHEVLHPALLFWSRLKGREHQRANIAHDFVINLILEEWGSSGKLKLVQPDNVLYNTKYRGMSFEEVYESIKVNKIEIPMGGIGGGLMYDCKPGTGGNTDESGNELGGNGWGMSKEEELEWKGKLARAQALHQAISQDGWGSVPAGLKRLVKDLLEPKLDWFQLLSRWVGENGKRENRTFQRPSRRSHALGAYLASPVKFGFADVAVLLDTSGSISDRDMKDALAEVGGICEDLDLRTRVIVCDAEVHDDVTIGNVHELLPHIRGGGGSNYMPAFKLLEDTGFNGVVVAITDGYITVPKQPPPHVRDTLWILNKNGRPPCSWGESISIDKGKIDADEYENSYR